MVIYQLIKISLFALLLRQMKEKPEFNPSPDHFTRHLFCVSSLPEMLKKVAFIVSFFMVFSLLSQETVNQHIESELSKLYKEDYNKKKEIKVDGKKYRIYSNYLTLGAGKAYNSAWDDILFNPALDFNFHLQKSRFQAGGLLQGRTYGDNQLIHFHLCYGYRKESYKYFWAIYGGLSYMTGHTPIRSKGIGGKDSVLIYPTVSSNGIYAAAQFFYKVKFDYGIGLTIFGDANKYQSMVGARIELFFSGAYRGTIRHKDEE